MDIDLLRERLKTFVPDKIAVPRWLAAYSAAVATADPDCLEVAVKRSTAAGLKRADLYEIVLQSYLFLGFPRMLIAAENLDRVSPSGGAPVAAEKISEQEANDWFDRGLELYQRVYDSNSEVLQDKVSAFAPEVFRWMIIEGYGKVLSRPGLDIADRELSIVAFLMMENREKQLHSHLRGALNVGVKPEVLRIVADDIGESAGDGYRTMLRLLNVIGAA